MTSHRRILLISDDFKPNSGGIAEMLENIVREWSKRGARVQVVTPWAEAEYVEEPYERIPYHSCRDRLMRYGTGFLGWSVWKARRFLLGKTAWLRWNPWRSSYYRTLVRRSQPQVILFGLFSPRCSHILRAVLSQGAIVALLVHAAEIPFYMRTHRRRLLADLLAIDRVLCVSRYTLSMVRAIGVPEDRLVLVPMGVRDIRNIASPRDAGELELLEKIGERRLILSVGTLTPRKGFDNVIRAVRSVVDAGVDAVYLLAGEGQDRERLAGIAHEHGVSDRVLFSGSITEQMKAELYRRCDFFVMPSRQESGWDIEGFGIVYLEAALFGKPAIGGNSGGVPDAVHDGQTGLLVDPCSVDEIGHAMLRLLRDEELRRSLGAQAREDVLRNHGWPFCAEEILNALRPSVSPGTGRAGPESG